MQFQLSITYHVKTDARGRSLRSPVSTVMAEADLGQYSGHGFPDRITGKLVNVPLGQILDLKYLPGVEAIFRGSGYAFEELEKDGTFVLRRSQSQSLKVQLLPAPGEGPRSTPEYQKALGGFAESLRSQGVEVSPRYYANDAVGGGGGLSGEFTVMAAAVGGLIVAVRPCLVEWIKGRYGRKTKLKIGDIEAEAHTIEEVEKLMKLAEEHQKRMAANE